MMGTHDKARGPLIGCPRAQIETSSKNIKIRLIQTSAIYSVSCDIAAIGKIVILDEHTVA